VVDASGSIVASYTYDAWGRLLSASGAMASINPIRYRGYYYDTETGLYYLQSRYYDPEVCRFINADAYASTGQGILGCNMFAYCGNNPVRSLDTSGNYDRDAIVDYANQWVYGSNTSYYHYRTDCANFVSQCLFAGGISYTEDWYSFRSPKLTNNIIDGIKAFFHNNYRYDWEISESWRLAKKQYEYFSEPTNGFINGAIITISSSTQIASIAANGGIQPGDLLYFSNHNGVHHATIVTMVDTEMIYYSGHTNSALNKPLSSGIGNDTVYIIRIFDDA